MMKKAVLSLGVVPAVLLLSACGGGGGGGVVEPPAEETPPGTLETLAERQAFALSVLSDQESVLASGAANPADLPASASYEGSWAMSLDPGGDLEVIGGTASLQAEFSGGSVTGSLQQEILAGAEGALVLQNGQVAGADLSAEVVGNLSGAAGISVDAALDGFFTADGVQGTMSGAATRDGTAVGAQGALAATRD